MSCSRIQRSAADEAQTCNPSISSQATTTEPLCSLDQQTRLAGKGLTDVSSAILYILPAGCIDKSNDVSIMPLTKYSKQLVQVSKVKKILFFCSSA